MRHILLSAFLVAALPVAAVAQNSSIDQTLADVQKLLQAQSEQLRQQQREIDELRHQLNDQQQKTAEHAAAALSQSAAALAPAPVAPPSQVVTAEPSHKSSDPLSIHFGNASLTPGGWVDFTAYGRSTDVGSGLGTSFQSIPYNNTINGGLSEVRFSAQASRITLRADEQFGKTRVFAYTEADFNGYLPSNAYVSTNSDSLRLRVYFTDLTRGKWEFLGGQSWSLLTPNRVGVSPFLNEIYNTMHLDTNYTVGLTYARQAQLRAVYRFTPNVAWGLSAENPEQFSGGAATFPTLFSTAETDLGSSTGAGGGTSTPTLHPDVISKLSVDAHAAGRSHHFELAGLLTSFAIDTPATVTRNEPHKDVREGGGVLASANVEAVKNVHVILTGFWSDGGGRYIGALGPAFVVAQQGAKTAPFTAQLVHSGSAIAAVEWKVDPRTVLSFTGSGAYFSRVSSVDPSTNALVGYGFKGSANSNNRAIDELTLASQTTLWKSAGYGAVQFLTQSSYITRSPWYVAPGAPKDAHVFVGYANLRYVLP